MSSQSFDPRSTQGTDDRAASRGIPPISHMLKQRSRVAQGASHPSTRLPEPTVPLPNPFQPTSVPADSVLDLQTAFINPSAVKFSATVVVDPPVLPEADAEPVTQAQPDLPEAKATADSAKASSPPAAIADPPIPEAPPPAAPDAAKPRSGQSRRSLRLSTLWLSFFLGCTGTGLVAIAWLTRLPPPPQCDQLSPFAADVDQLYCAQQAAKSGKVEDLQAGIKLVQGWSPQHLLYAEAQGLLTQWSGSVLAIAESQLAIGDLEAAVETARLIPNSSPLYSETQNAIAQWQTEWKQGRALDEAAQNALATQSWKAAREHLQEMLSLSHDYWVQNRGGKLRSQIQREEQGHQQLVKARQAVKTGSPQNLSEAIALAQTIPLQTHAWKTAQAEVNTWSKRLLNIAFQRWEKGDLDGAIAAVQGVPPDPALAPEARDLMQISYAEKAASGLAGQWQPSVGQLLSLHEAITAVEQIPPESPFYERAQEHLQRWQAELVDLTQLQYAQLTAYIGQKMTFQAAIEQASLIGSERPRRGQAQTLIAHWQREIERVEDRPYLARAQTLAQTASIPNLKAAIAEAQQIRQGRALRAEAQTAIALWNRQIETIEDQPILTQANQLAQQGKLRQAIETARKIAEGRALYSKAQEQVQGWTAQIQLAEDQPILDRAIALANQGSLTRAIEVASQIAGGRALSREAQAYISRWDRERTAIWATRAAEAASSSDADSETYSEEPYEDSYEEPSGDEWEEDY